MAIPANLIQHWRKFEKALNARKQEERVVLLLVVIVVLAYGGFVAVLEPLQLKRADFERRLQVTNAQILEENNRQNEIQTTFSSDPDAFARNRQEELMRSVSNADAELDRLYGQLIDPREMALMLAGILQRESGLELISLSNRPSELLLSTASGDAAAASNDTDDVELYRHGLQMVFEGSYLDTIRYLKTLEDQQNNFFWESMQYTVQEYPRARITLDIYTLSTQQGWIGV